MTVNCSSHPTLQVYGKCINHVSDFKYLGCRMASSYKDLTRRKALAWSAFWKLEHIWRSTIIPVDMKVRLFNTTCVTVLLYGCESWVLTSDMENKINSFATSCYRVMLNIKRIDHVPNSRIYDDTNTEPLVNRVRLRQLKFLGHILRMPEEEPCRLYALYTPSHGRRKPGRQRTSYLSYIQKLLGDTNSMLHPKAIADLAQNRSDWRKFAIACCAADRWWHKYEKLI